jgi:hypothetical protein
MNLCAAIIGPDGSGKITLPEDLQCAFMEQGHKTRMVFVNDTAPLDGPACRRLLSELAPDELVLLDGADLVPRSCWSLTKRHTIRHAFGLVITSHRPGLLPTLLACSTTPALLGEITHDAARQPPSRRNSLPASMVAIKATSFLPPRTGDRTPKMIAFDECLPACPQGYSPRVGRQPRRPGSFSSA